jgi:hypothetical protein
MSAANDGADADSRIAAVARRLIFITVLMVRPVTGISSATSVPNSTPPVDGFNRQPHSARISPALFARQIRPGMGPKNPGNGHRGHGFPVPGPLSLRPIASPLLDQQIDQRHPSRLADRFRQQPSIVMEPPFRRNRNVKALIVSLAVYVVNDDALARFRQGQPIPPLQGSAGIVKAALPMLAHRCRREFVVL